MNKYILRSVKTMDVRKMFDGMQCRSCGSFPSPYYRFICEDSHLLCAHYVNIKFDDNLEICQLNLEDQRKRIDGGSNKGGESKSGTICRKAVRRFPADPVYTVFFNKAMWKCPGTVDLADDDPDARGCESVVKGEYLHLHLQTEHCQPDQLNKKRKYRDDWDNNGNLELHIEKKPTSSLLPTSKWYKWEGVMMLAIIHYRDRS